MYAEALGACVHVCMCACACVRVRVCMHASNSTARSVTMSTTVRTCVKNKRNSSPGRPAEPLSMSHFFGNLQHATLFICRMLAGTHTGTCTSRRAGEFSSCQQETIEGARQRRKRKRQQRSKKRGTGQTCTPKLVCRISIPRDQGKKLWFS